MEVEDSRKAVQGVKEELSRFINIVGYSWKEIQARSEENRKLREENEKVKGGSVRKDTIDEKIKIVVKEE